MVKEYTVIFKLIVHQNVAAMIGSSMIGVPLVKADCEQDMLCRNQTWASRLAHQHSNHSATRINVIVIVIENRIRMKNRQ